MATSPQDWCIPGSESATDPAGFLSPELLSALCSLGWRPQLITGFIRDLLVRHFSAPTQIEQPELRKSVWRPESPTGILIETITNWFGDKVELRPAVIVKRNAYRNLRLGIADHLGTDREGFDNYATFWVGSHTLFCIHGTGAAADLLATEVQRELTQFAHPIVKELALMRFQVTEVGAIAEVEEASENFVVPVTVGWAYQEKWRVLTESLPLRRIPVSFILDC